jgi:hypothetical protein
MTKGSTVSGGLNAGFMRATLAPTDDVPLMKGDRPNHPPAKGAETPIDDGPLMKDDRPNPPPAKGAEKKNTEPTIVGSLAWITDATRPAIEP